METKLTEFSYLEFVEHAKDRIWSNKFKSASAKTSRETDAHHKKWTGTKNFDEAIDFALNGWDAGLEQMELDSDLLTDVGTEFNPSVAGAVVNIGAYLQGNPECMYELADKREYNLDELTIYAPLCYSAYNDGKRAMNYSKSVVDFVNKMQSKHDVKLVGMFDTDQGAYRSVELINIKNFSERFVLNNVAFSFHPSFFRRLWLSFLEGTEYGIPWGYGSSSSLSQTRNLIEKELLGISGKSILLPALNDLSTNGSFTEDLIIELSRDVDS